jgi:electron transfer flavoprotein alpha/beta subunit
VDAAIRLKEKGIATEVVVVSIGVKPAQEALRNALAIGADRAKMTYTKGVLAEGGRQDGILTAPPEGVP